MPKIFVTLLLLMALPSVSYARHNTNRVNTSSLDDDPVESMPIPVLFGVEYEDMVPDFGDPRGGGTRTHEGQDMSAPLGTPIVSPTEAIVLSTGSGSSAGKYVYTANPGGETFRYMHLDEIADIKRGDELEPGDFIGTVGDTGNAPDGIYHLHFEIRPNNRPVDPYPRLTDTFTLKEKASFLAGILRGVDGEDAYAEFLVTTFRSDLAAMLNAGYDLPTEIEDALSDAGVVNQTEAMVQLRAVLAQVPKLLMTELQVGDESALVQLLQIYVMFNSSGPAHTNLMAAGATGYYGPITAAAVSEYQTKNGVAVTGMYDSTTRAAMMESELAK